MKEIIALSAVSILLLGFTGFGIYKWGISQRKSYKYPVIFSICLVIVLGGLTLYKVFIKTYHKVAAATDELIVKGASKTGEISGETASSFVASFEEGADKAYGYKVFLSKNLVEKGLETGAVVQQKQQELKIYFIYKKDFGETVSVKVLDNNNKEVARMHQVLNGKQNNAEYVAFEFTPDAAIKEPAKIVIE